MKIAVKKRYICPASEVFEMGGNDVLLAGSPLIINPGNAGNNESGGGNQTPEQDDMDDYEEGSPAPMFYEEF